MDVYSVVVLVGVIVVILLVFIGGAVSILNGGSRSIDNTNTGVSVARVQEEIEAYDRLGKRGQN